MDGLGGVVRGSNPIDGSGTPPVRETVTTGFVNCTRRAVLCAAASCAGRVGLAGRADRLGITATAAAAVGRWYVLAIP